MPEAGAPSRWRVAKWLLSPALCALALLMAWIVFYGFGQTLLASFTSPVAGR